MKQVVNWDEQMHAKYRWWYAFEMIVVLVICGTIIWALRFL